MRAAVETVPLILTPEHVPVRLFPAGLGSRFLAMMADTLFVVAVSYALYKILTFLIPFGLGTAVLVTLTFVLKWGYDVYFEVRRQGRTPGKRMVGLRVVDRRGLPITFQQSFVRNICRALDALPFYGVGALVCLLDPYRRRVGDLAADTLVIQEFRPLQASGQLTEERRFNSLRTPSVLRRIRHKISLEGREFLLTLAFRSERLDPKARFDLMEDVARHYREVLGVDDPHLSGENLVRGLISILYGTRS